MTSTLAATVFVLFFTYGALSLEVDGVDEKTIINVDLYYESLCPDSVRFVVQQLVPAYEIFRDYLRINFIPYGKAEHSRDSETNEWTFTCQHGPMECHGNEDQACALDAIGKNENIEDQQNLCVALVGCAMKSSRSSSAVTSCANTIGLKTETKRALDECRGSSHGKALLARHGDKTKRLEPPLTFVPTVIMNESTSIDTDADFQSVICNWLREDEKPRSCGQ